MIDLWGELWGVALSLTLLAAVSVYHSVSLHQLRRRIEQRPPSAPSLGLSGLVVCSVCGRPLPAYVWDCPDDGGDPVRAPR